MNRRAQLYSFSELWRHYRNCRRNKRNTLNALRFEIDTEANLLGLQRELRDHAYAPGRSICFVTDGDKPREVFAADFRDRIVHHLLVSHLERVFEPRFIHDSYACRKGKGTLAASDRLMQFQRQVTANGRRPAWAIKLDVASFFPSIHKQTLYDLIAQRVRDPELLWLTRVILFHDPTQNYRFKPGPERVPPPQSDDYPVPPRKSLFAKDNERGLPIGNLTSQFWANLYMNEVDQFVKRKLRCRQYVRYVDDMVLLSNDADELRRWRGEIERFLQTRLRLALREEGQEPVPGGRGIDFVGWTTWWNHRLPRRQTLSRLRERVDVFERRKVKRAFGDLGRRIALGDGEGIERLRQTLASYSGHLRHGAAWSAWNGTWTEYGWLRWVFRRQGWAFAPRWPERRRALRFRDRYAALLRGAGDDCLIFHRVGRYVEFYGPQRLLAEPALGLRRAYLPRPGYAFVAGFPVWLAGRFAARALRQGLGIVVVVPSASAGPSRVTTFAPARGAFAN